MEQITSTYDPFSKAINKGQVAEERVANILRAAGALISKLNKDERHDVEIVFNNHTFRVEVKNEDNYQGSDFIWIETLQGNPLRPSGLVVSEATMFLHTMGNKCVLYRRRDMHRWVNEQHEAGNIRLLQRGDNNNHGYRVPIARLTLASQQSLRQWFDHRETHRLTESDLWTY